MFLFDNRTSFAALQPSAFAEGPKNRRGKAAHDWNRMKNRSRYNRKHKTQAILPTPSQQALPRPLSDWKPEPCGLSREELREIVAQIMG